MGLWKRILIGLFSGILVGIILGEKAEYLKPIGDLFIRSIGMLIVPLVFSSLVSGVISMKDPGKMGRIGLKTIALYLVTTSVAISIGLLFGGLIRPGNGMSLSFSGKVEDQQVPSIVETFINMVPDNPVKALASGNMLQIIIFSILLGVCINLAGEKGKPVGRLFESVAEVMYKMTGVIMNLAPIGVFALIAWVAGKYGLDVLLPLFKVVVGVYLGVVVHALFTYSGILLMARLNPLPFFRGILDAQLVAFTTTSSSGTLPVTLSCVQNNLGVSKSISSFVLPLGATINMDGTALYQGVCALFISQAYGIELSSSDFVTIIITATLASIGTAGVPGAGLIMLSLVLKSVGLPLEGIALVAGVDRILDMARTAVNVTGDAMVSVVVAKSEREFDKSVYSSKVKF